VQLTQHQYTTLTKRSFCEAINSQSRAREETGLYWSYSLVESRRDTFLIISYWYNFTFPHCVTGAEIKHGRA